jgi:hypothetical protein
MGEHFIARNAIANIAAQMEYACGGKAKDDSAEGGEADHRSSVR